MTDNPTEADFRKRLTEYLEAVSDNTITVDFIQRLAGGTSRDSWLVQASIQDVPRRLVVRRDQHTVMVSQALERSEEFQVMKAAHDAGVKVPAPLYFCTEPLILDGRFMVMEFVDGVSIGRQVVSSPDLEDARRVLPAQLGEALALIHKIDYKQENLSFLPRPRPGFSPVEEALAQIQSAIQALALYNPVFAYGIRWLQQKRPRRDHKVLVHGDYRVGNFLVGAGGLNGIIDWEYSHVGDPLEDLAWICVRDWRYGAGRLPMGGISSREPFIEAYEAAGGETVDRSALAWWEVVGNLRWAVASLAQARRHLSGGDYNVELASLGRRSAEMQLEMLRLIQKLED